MLIFDLSLEKMLNLRLYQLNELAICVNLFGNQSSWLLVITGKCVSLPIYIDIHEVQTGNMSGHLEVLMSKFRFCAMCPGNSAPWKVVLEAWCEDDGFREDDRNLKLQSESNWVVELPR